MDEFTGISLFSGVGGFDQAFEHTGGKVLVQVEKDKFCLNILERHYPYSLRINDVKKANRSNLPAVDVVFGGFPCTGMSVAGKRQGLDDDGSSLWWEFWRIIMELKPGYVFIENVPGLLSSHSGRDFAVVLGGLTGILPEVPENGWRNSGFAIGRKDCYHVTYRCFDSQFCGVPQRRRRIFIVGCLSSSRISPAEILFESEGLSWHPQKSREKGQAATATLNASPPSRRNGGSSPTESAFVYDQENPEENARNVYHSIENDEIRQNQIISTLAASGAGVPAPLEMPTKPICWS